MDPGAKGTRVDLGGLDGQALVDLMDPGATGTRTDLSGLDA